MDWKKLKGNGICRCNIIRFHKVYTSQHVDLLCVPEKRKQTKKPLVGWMIAQFFFLPVTFCCCAGALPEVWCWLKKSCGFPGQSKNTPQKAQVPYVLLANCPLFLTTIAILDTTKKPFLKIVSIKNKFYVVFWYMFVGALVTSLLWSVVDLGVFGDVESGWVNTTWPKKVLIFLLPLKFLKEKKHVVNGYNGKKNEKGISTNRPIPKA